MKVLILLSLLLTSKFIQAQRAMYGLDSSILLSKYEEYCTTPGKLLKTNVRQMGDVRSARIEVLETIDIRKADTVSVVRISSANFENKSLIDNQNFYFDKEELQTIIRVVQYYNTQITSGQVSEQNSYSYITNSDVQLRCYYQDGFFNNLWISFGKVYHYLRTSATGGYSFGKRDIEPFIQLLQSAEEAL